MSCSRHFQSNWVCRPVWFDDVIDDTAGVCHMPDSSYPQKLLAEHLLRPIPFRRTALETLRTRADQRVQPGVGWNRSSAHAGVRALDAVSPRYRLRNPH